MSGPNLKVDTREFQKEFRKRVLRSRRTIGEVTNEVAFQILRAWQRLIPKASRAIIEALGITYRTRTKTGKLLKRKQAIYTPTSAFKLIALKEMWKRGPNPRSFANRQQLDEQVRKKLGRRSSSVGFVATGPVPAMRALLKKIHGAAPPGLRTFPGTKGSAKAADEGSWNPEVTIENATGMNGPFQTAVSSARVESELMAQLQKAVDEVAQDMAAYEKKIEKVLADGQ